MYDRALKINPYECMAYANKGKIFGVILGVALGNLGKFDEAITMYDHALKINPNECMTYANKGKIFRFIFRSCTRQFRKILWGNNNVWSCSED